MSKGRILIVDDDRTLVRLMREALSKAEFEIVTAFNGIDALQELYAKQPDLVLLDVMMPRMDGWETATRIRQVSKVPIIMLTAKDEESDKLKGFAAGVDDYVTKPFSFAEMVARVQAVLNRARMAPPEHKPKRYASGTLVIDTDSRRVMKNGKVVELTPTEYRLLVTLAENSGRVLSHEQLLNKVWGYEYGEDTGYVKRYVWYLRRKVEDDPRKPEHILTERGFGYLFQGD
ncbi:MAG: response regulator transcription factor [Chloroflexi bacterium]|jgi:two-component system KDP operon response regulator KdpE|nr:response regulator transcription factor [Chloroflexota bacterium]